MLENGDKVEVLAKNNEDYEIIGSYRLQICPAVYDLLKPDAFKYFRVIPKDVI